MEGESQQTTGSVGTPFPTSRQRAGTSWPRARNDNAPEHHRVQGSSHHPHHKKYMGVFRGILRLGVQTTPAQGGSQRPGDPRYLGLRSCIHPEDWGPAPATTSTRIPSTHPTATAALQPPRGCQTRGGRRASLSTCKAYRETRL